MPHQVYQGDIGFIPASRAGVKGGLTPVQPQGDRLIVAYGEVTGHHHSFPATCGTISLDEGGTMWCTIDQLTHVEHQEHGPITLEPGFYRVGAPGQRGGQREWSDLHEPIRVTD